MLIDTHAHLTDEAYSKENILIDELSPKRIITVGYDYKSSKEGYLIAKQNPSVFCALGIHPSNTFDAKKSHYDEFLTLAKDEKCVAIGEIGLDYHYEDTNKSVQHKEFLNQLELASEADLPVIIHLRDAFEDMERLIKANKHKINRGGVMHCFCGSLETAKMYIDLGFYISFSGNITFKNAKKFPDIINALPRDRVLIETDCPYLAPHPHRGELNYPKYVRLVAEKIASIWEIVPSEVEQITFNNAKSVFTKLT